MLTAAGILGFMKIKKKPRASSKPLQMNGFKKPFRSPLGIAAAVLIATVLAAGGFLLVKKLTAPTAPKEPEFAAIVNGEKIPYAEFQSRLNAQTYFYSTVSPLPEILQGLPEAEEGKARELPPEQERTEKVRELIKEQVREDMIQEILLTQLLREHEIMVSDEEVRQRIQTIAVDQLYGGDWAKYEEDLKTVYRMTIDEVMRTYRLELLKEKTAGLKTQKHVLAIWIEKKEFQFASYESMTEEGRVQHKEVNRTKREKADEALKRLQEGEEFAVAAREFSEDEKGSQSGGDLGFLFLPDKEAPFLPDTEQKNFRGLTAAFLALEELNAGETKLYETFTDYTIIKITEIKEAPLGNQSFDQWYQGFRSRANVIIP